MAGFDFDALPDFDALLDLDERPNTFRNRKVLESRRVTDAERKSPEEIPGAELTASINTAMAVMGDVVADSLNKAIDSNHHPEEWAKAATDVIDRSYTTLAHFLTSAASAAALLQETPADPTASTNPELPHKEAKVTLRKDNASATAITEDRAIALLMQTGKAYDKPSVQKQMKSFKEAGSTLELAELIRSVLEKSGILPVYGFAESLQGCIKMKIALRNLLFTSDLDTHKKVAQHWNTLCILENLPPVIPGFLTSKVREDARPSREYSPDSLAEDQKKDGDYRGNEKSLFDFDELPEAISNMLSVSLFPESDTHPGKSTHVANSSRVNRGDVHPATCKEVSMAYRVTKFFNRAGYSEQDMKEKSSRIGMMCGGTRGDCKPLIVLARTLMLMKHEVRMFTSSNLVQLCNECEVDAVPVFPSSEDILYDKDYKVTFHDSNKEQTRKVERFSDKWYKANPTAFTNYKVALQEYEPELLVCSSHIASVGMWYESETGVPCIPFFSNPDLLKEFSHLLNSKPTRPAFFAMSPILDCNQSVPLEGVERTGPWLLHEEPPDECYGGLRGPFVSEFAQLREFLKSGDTPIAIGFGSSVYRDLLPSAALLAKLLRALRIADRRAVIIGGWAGLHKVGRRLLNGQLTAADMDCMSEVELIEMRAFAASQVFFVGDAPKSWLFPRCRCIVHHGGAGNTQAAMFAGVPSVVTPVWHSSLALSKAIDFLGAGVGFEVPLYEINAQQLARAIVKAENMASGACRLQQRMRGDKDVIDAAAAIDVFMSTQVKAGFWKAKFDAKWSMPKMKPW